MATTTERHPNLGGQRTGAGRPPKLTDPQPLRVDVEGDLRDRLDTHRKSLQIPNKSGNGTRDTPRGDVVSAALELYLGDFVPAVESLLDAMDETTGTLGFHDERDRVRAALNPTEGGEA